MSESLSLTHGENRLFELLWTRTTKTSGMEGAQKLE